MTFLAAALAFVLALQEPSTLPTGPVWLDDLAAATTLARESERPLLVVFR